LSWFRGDIGGKKNIADKQKNIKLLMGNKNGKIRFKKYDWSLFLQNYKDDTE